MFGQPPPGPVEVDRAAVVEGVARGVDVHVDGEVGLVRDRRVGRVLHEREVANDVRRGGMR